MAAPKGNQFWKARSSHGRRPKFKSPEQMSEAAEEYFQWVEDNPLWEIKAFHHQGKITEHSLPKMRAMTIMGLCGFLDISEQCWSEYKQRKGFGEVTRGIDRRIRQQKFEGAAAEFLNPNIIARDLGLSEKIGGDKNNPVVIEQNSPAEKVKDLLDKKADK